MLWIALVSLVFLIRSVNCSFDGSHHINVTDLPADPVADVTENETRSVEDISYNE